jgi:hypothetical protein
MIWAEVLEKSEMHILFPLILSGVCVDVVQHLHTH